MKIGLLLQEWVKTMAAYVKSLDSKHLLTVGEEGFYPAGDANPSGNQTYVTVCYAMSQRVEHAMCYLL